MNRMMAIIERELRKFFRSPTLMLVSMVFPLVQLIVLGNAFGGKIRDAKLGLVDEDTTVPQAFADLDEFVNRMLTPEEKSAMTYDVLTGEHSLCKYKWLYSRK